MNTTRNRTTHATFVFFEDARRGFDAFLGQLWHGADQMRPDVRVHNDLKHHDPNIGIIRGHVVMISPAARERCPNRCPVA